MKHLIASVVLAGSVMTVAVGATQTLPGSQFLPQTKVSLQQARQTALAKEHGTIVAQELEKENGTLRYSFDVKIGKVVHEVGVDAVTGKVIEDSIDNGND